MPSARGALVGVLSVVAAVVVGVAIAWLLAALGLTGTETVLLGSWLAGLGLLGGWQQVVTSDVAGGLEWSTWAAGAPLLITGAAAAVVASLIRRMRVGHLGVAGAGLGAGGAAAVLVAASQRTLTTTNEAGRVDVSEGLTWWWTGGLRPGTVTGAVALAVLVGLVSTVGARWWREGRAVACGVVVVPGLLITLAAAAGAVWLTSSAAVGVALAVLYPMLGSAVLLAAGGAPGEGGLTRITPEPYVVSTWSSGLVVALGGLVGMPGCLGCRGARAARAPAPWIGRCGHDRDRGPGGPPYLGDDHNRRRARVARRPDPPVREPAGVRPCRRGHGRSRVAGTGRRGSVA